MADRKTKLASTTTHSVQRQAGKSNQEATVAAKTTDQWKPTGPRKTGQAVFLPPKADQKQAAPTGTGKPITGWKSSPTSRTGPKSIVDRRVTPANYQPALPTPKSFIKQPAQTIPAPPEPDGDLLPPSPSAPVRVRIPVAGTVPGEDVQLRMSEDQVSLVARNATVGSILNLLAQHQGLNLIAGDDLSAIISVTLNDVPFEAALTSIVSIAGYTWSQQNNIILVTKISSEATVAPEVQGRILQVFPLSFVNATDVELAVRGLLSPTGQSFISQATPTDKRRTQELIVVEDIPASVLRIAQYIHQIDQPPRQVMIEAHVLQVNLTDETRHGVNWKYLTTIAGSPLA